MITWPTYHRILSLDLKIEFFYRKVTEIERRGEEEEEEEERERERERRKRSGDAARYLPPPSLPRSILLLFSFLFIKHTHLGRLDLLSGETATNFRAKKGKKIKLIFLA